MHPLEAGYFVTPPPQAGATLLHGVLLCYTPAGATLLHPPRPPPPPPPPSYEGWGWGWAGVLRPRGGVTGDACPFGGGYPLGVYPPPRGDTPLT